MTFKTINGSRQVITFSQDGVFFSRLYVNNGETITLIAATHTTEKGARKWAAKALAA